jgi:alkylation response protein AidB-like acyl-CoA dehydrogenase
MDFTFSDEHEDLRNTIRQFLTNESNENTVRKLMETDEGYDPAVWKRMAEEMGLPGLIIPEEHGGAGMGYVELLIALEEMGRELFCAPFLSTAVLATNALLLAGNAAAQKDLLAKIAAGEALATVAYVEPVGRWDLGGVQMQAQARDGGFVLDGEKTFVLDGHVADVVLVVARVDGGLGLFQAEGAGIERTSLPTLDLTRKLARLEFKAVPARRIDAGGDASAALEEALARTVAALTAEQVGGAQRCLEMATDYAKSRLQFGRPIGSYQAIKHDCADMLVDVEFAKSAAYNACFTAATGDGDMLQAAAGAKSFCSDAFFHAAADNIQIHGGMGFTWEASPHLYFKRAKSSAELFGDPTHHRELLAQRLGI